MARTASVSAKKKILEKILKDPVKRKQLAQSLGSQPQDPANKKGGIGLLLTLEKQFPAEVKEVMGLIAEMPEPRPKKKKTKRKAAKKASKRKVKAPKRKASKKKKATRKRR